MREISAFDVLRDGEPCQGRFDARPCFGNALFQVFATGNRVTETSLECAVFFRQAAGDFNQAGYSFAQHLEFFVHVAGWYGLKDGGSSSGGRGRRGR